MGALAVYRDLLANRALVRLLVSEFVSSIGDWLYLVALIVVVWRESHDPGILGAVGAARIVPYFILSVPAGFAADRFDRRLVLLVTDLIRGAIMVGLAAVAFAHGPLWAIVALAILATCFSPFFYPAIGAYIPSLVRDERELGPANSAWASLDTLAFIVGPAVGGVLIAVSDLSFAFVLNAVTFAIVAAVLWSLPPSIAGESPRAGAPTVPKEGGQHEAVGSAEGVAAPSGWLVRAVIRPLGGLALVNMAASFVVGGLGILTVILAVDRLGAGEAGTGYLNAAVGVGGLIGAVASGALVLRPNLAAPLVAGAVLMAVGVAWLGASTLLVAAFAAMAIASCGSMLTEVVSTTVFQRVVPDELRGRALGVLMTGSRVAYAAGALLIPVLATNVGPFVVLAAAGVLVVAAAIVALALVGDAVRLEPSVASETLRRIKRLPILAGVAPAALEVAAARLRPLEVPAGTAVVRQGEAADRFYVIERGRFAVDQADERGSVQRLRTLGPDDVFGELGLLRGAPRSATVTALVDGGVLALDGSDFLELVNSGAGVPARLLGLYAGGPTGGG